MEQSNEPPNAGMYEDWIPPPVPTDRSSIRSSIRSSREVPQAPYSTFQAYQSQSTSDLPLPPGTLYYRPLSPMFARADGLEDIRASTGNLYDSPPYQPQKHYSLGAQSFYSRSSTPANDRKRVTLSGITTVPNGSHLAHEMTWPFTPVTMTPASARGSIVDMSLEKGQPNDSSYSVREHLSEKTAIGDAPTPTGSIPPVPSGPAGPPGQAPPSWSKLHNAGFILCVCLAQFLSLSSLAQTVAPLLIIGKDLNVTNPGQLSWFTAAYSMSLGTFIVPSGRMGDMFGHKRMFLLGWLWFSLFSFLAGFSHSWGPIAFSVMRGFQGIGPALLVPNAMALIGRTYPMGDKRALVFSLFGACGPTGFLTGSFFSSLLAQYTEWPWIFWATAIASTIITFYAYCIIPDSMAIRPVIPGQPNPKFDYLGCFTGVAGLILINFALNQAPLVGWDTPYVYFILIIGVILTLGFFYVELYMTDQPLLPVRGLQPQAILALGCIAAGWASHGIWIYYLYLFQMRIRDLSPLHTTANLFPVAPLGIAFALSTNGLIKRIGVAKVMFIAMVLFFTGTVILAFVPASQTYWAQTFVSILVMPGGMNLSFPAGTILLSNAMPREHQGKAASLVSTVVNYSIASGLGIAGTVERNVNKDGSKLLQGYRGAWDVGIGFSALGLLLSVYFMWHLRRR